MRESVAADHAFVRREVGVRRGPRDRGADGPGVQGRDPRRPRARRPWSRRRRCRRSTFYEHGPFRDLCKGPHVESTGHDRAVQAARRRRRLLAGRREAPDAPADLRHGLGDAGGARPVTCGGARRRRSATTASWASQLDLFSFHDVSPGRRVLAPQGPAALADAARRRCASSRTAAATRRSPRRSLVHQRLWEAVRPLGRSTARTCSSSRVEGQTFSLKPMNCPESHVHLPIAPALVPRPAAAPSASTAGCTATSVGHAVRPHARAPVHPGRRPHLRPAGPARRRDRGADGRGRASRTAGSGSSPTLTFGTQPDKALGDPALWEQAEA